MKAVCCPRYGTYEVLKLVEIEKPSPKDNEVLMKVHAASINSHDDRIMRGKPILVRFREGLFTPRRGKKILGTDIAGTVEAVGKSVTGFSIGDRVFGCIADTSGGNGFAEYACAKASELAPIPKGISFEQAASVPMAAVTALQGLRDAGKIRQGQKVLVNGASGGVGTFAVQIAKAFGAEVTGVCSSRNIDMVRSIGADYVIDYTKEDFTKSGLEYDLILDIAANHSLAEYRQALKPNGICAVIGFSTFAFLFKIMLFGKQTTKKDGKILALVMADNTKSGDLLVLNQLLESGKVSPVIDGSYSIDETAKAFQYFQKEHAKGKVIITF